MIQEITFTYQPPFNIIEKKLIKIIERQVFAMPAVIQWEESDVEETGIIFGYKERIMRINSTNKGHLNQVPIHFVSYDPITNIQACNIVQAICRMEIISNAAGFFVMQFMVDYLNTTRPTWIKKLFPEWDYEAEFNFEKKEKPIKNAKVIQIGPRLCSKE